MVGVRAWIVALAVMAASPAVAATCGNGSAGFPGWVTAFGREASARGVDRRVLDAVLPTLRYSTSTIAADRGQKSFKLDLQTFMKKRGSATIVSRGRKMKARYAGLFAAIERRYGVPAGPLIAIWGMETGFGAMMGKTPTLSAVATLAYDCRRSAFFTEQFYAALELVAEGKLKVGAIGAAHGEVGHTQFLPKNVLLYGVDGDGDGRVDLAGSSADALASTANFLKGHGWRPGVGYQPGEANFAAIAGWNAATVYEQAIAIMGAAIDHP